MRDILQCPLYWVSYCGCKKLYQPEKLARDKHDSSLCSNISDHEKKVIALTPGWSNFIRLSSEVKSFVFL